MFLSSSIWFTLFLVMDFTIAGLTTGILVALFTFVISLPRLIYFSFKGNDLFGKVMFKGKNLAFFILSFLSSIACTTLAILFSTNFFYLGLFFVYMTISSLGVSLYLITWVMFWMHGNDGRLQFVLIDRIPCPMAILSSFVILLGSIMTLNYYMLGCALIYTFCIFGFDISGYKLTKVAKNPTTGGQNRFHDDD